MQNHEVDKSFNRVSYRNNNDLSPMIIAYIIIDHPNKNVIKRDGEIRAFSPEHISTIRYGNRATTEVLLDLPDTKASMFLNMPMEQACKTIQAIKHNTQREEYFDLCPQTVFDDHPNLATSTLKRDQVKEQVKGWNFSR